MRPIALTGFKRTGKSTIAKEVAYRLDHFVVKSFADGVRKGLAGSTGLPVELFYDQEAKEEPLGGPWDMTLREGLQEFGMALREHIDRDFWADCMAMRIEEAARSGKRVIIDDCRFPNEADMVREKGGLVVGLRRPGVELDDDHASETAMADNWRDMIDLELDNRVGEQTPTDVYRNLVQAVRRAGGDMEALNG